MVLPIVGIDEVRELRDSAKYQAIRDRYRIFIIDEVHMLTTEAFNALLKILEEPPPHVFFIFATTEKHKVPATIASRVQVFDFKRITDNVLVQRLSHITKEEGINISDRSLELIASLHLKAVYVMRLDYSIKSSHLAEPKSKRKKLYLFLDSLNSMQ